MKLRKILFVLFTLCLLTLTVVAIDDETSNACDDGGFMDGQCNTTDVDLDGDVDQQDIDWMWECGWWLMRVQSGDVLNDDVPLDGCRLPEREIPRPDKGSPYTPKPRSTGEDSLPEPGDDDYCDFFPLDC